jgi:hypothetical protein
MYPSDQTALDGLGRRASTLLTGDLSWIRRRKESVVLLDETILRRQMSVDYELPDTIPKTEDSPTGDPVYHAPLFLLQKGSDAKFDPAAPLNDPEPHFANFDFRDRNGSSLSLPTRVWNANVSVAALKSVAEDAADRLGLALEENEQGLDEFLSYVCCSEQLLAVKQLEALRELGKGGEGARGIQALEPEIGLLLSLQRDHAFRALLEACAISSIVMVALHGNAAKAGIIKLSYDEQIASLDHAGRKSVAARLGWVGYELWVDTPFVGAANYHFEIQAPAGLEMYDAGLVEVPFSRSSRDGARLAHSPQIARISGFATRVHLYVSEAQQSRKAFAWVRIRARRQDFIGGATLAASAVSLVLLAGWALASEIKNSPSTVPTLLLLFPTGLAVYAIKPGRHRLTTRMLSYARGLLGVVLALPFFAAAALDLNRRNEDGSLASEYFACWWFWLGIAGVFCFAALLLAYFLPQPEINRRRAREKVLSLVSTITQRIFPKRLRKRLSGDDRSG